MRKIFLVRRERDSNYVAISNLNNVYQYIKIEWELEPLVVLSSFYNHMSKKEVYRPQCRTNSDNYVTVIIIRMHVVGNVEIKNLQERKS